MLQAVGNAFRLPDLRRKILFTLGIMVIYRLAAHVPLPNVDREALRRFFEGSQLLGLLDMFSGGAMSSFSVVALGVYPYITATIVMQLITPVIPRLQELSKEGEAGRNLINQYTHLLTVPLAGFQAFAQATILSRQGILSNFGFGAESVLPSLAIVFSLAAGTIFAVWLGELITEQGVGNGVSIIIFGGIVAQIPQRVGQMWIHNKQGVVVFLALGLITIAAIVMIQEGQRRIPVQYGRRVRGTRVYGGQSTHIPLQVNAAGMIPIIFAQSFLILPGVISSYFRESANPWVAWIAGGMYRAFDSSVAYYWLVFFVMVVGFTYFYTDIVFKQQNLPETLQRQGGFIPGIRPGRRTAEYVNGVLQRITLVGAIFLGTVAVLPFLARIITGVEAMIISGTGLLIVVGVVIDTMKQLEAQLIMRHYEGFIR